MISLIVILDNGMILWYVTADKIGNYYADGIDNDGDGYVDEQIDIESMMRRKHG